MTTSHSFKGNGIDILVIRNDAGNITIHGHVSAFIGFPQKIQWIAPKGPHRCMSFSGSGLPYHNADQAFEGTENKGTINSPDGKFSLEMVTLPSAYYTGLGSVYVPPVLLIESVKTGLSPNNEVEKFRTHVFLNNGVPNRWVAGSPPESRVPPAKDEVGRAMFYTGREELPFFQNQEMLCRAKGYPSKEASYALSTHFQVNPWDNIPAPA